MRRREKIKSFIASEQHLRLLIDHCTHCSHQCSASLYTLFVHLLVLLSQSPLAFNKKFSQSKSADKENRGQRTYTHFVKIRPTEVRRPLAKESSKSLACNFVPTDRAMPLRLGVTALCFRLVLSCFFHLVVVAFGQRALVLIYVDMHFCVLSSYPLSHNLQKGGSSDSSLEIV